MAEYSDNVTGLTGKQKKLSRYAGLQTERSSWLPRWQEISRFLLPFSGRYTSTDRNRGDKSFNAIYDSSATWAHGVAAAGLMAGASSPARPWFRLATQDKQLMERGPVKQWLADVTDMMLAIFNKSNTYNALHTMYEELLAFGTTADIVDPDYDSVIWHTPMTAGEFCIATDRKGNPNTLYREFEMTIANIVEEFVQKSDGGMDWSVVSPTVKNLWDTNKAYDSWVPVLHTIEPRAYSERVPGKIDAKNMPWSSCYYELGNSAADHIALRESGYKDMPALIARWHTRGRDIYGQSPTMRALGDIKQLQQEQLRKGQAIDFMSAPPVAVPSDFKQSTAILPGGTVAMSNPQQIKNLYDVRIDLSHLLEDVNDVRQRINRTFYVDLFLAISSDPRLQPPSAREIAERHEEKLIQLGPVLERLHGEMLSRLIDIAFTRMIRTGIVPPIPTEMQGQNIKVEFISTLAQAQRAVGLAGFDRLLGMVVQVAPVKPDILDKIDMDQIVDKISDMLAIDPSCIVTDDKVAFIRAQRAQQMAAAQMAANAPAMAKGARDLSQADTEGKNGLTDVLNMFQGYTQQR